MVYFNGNKINIHLYYKKTKMTYISRLPGNILIKHHDNLLINILLYNTQE